MSAASDRSGGAPTTPRFGMDSMRTPVSPGDSARQSGASSMVVPPSASTVRTRRRRELGDTAMYSRPTTPGASSVATPMTDRGGDDDFHQPFESQAIIFGTDVNMADCQERLLKFLTSFQRDSDDQPYYKLLIAQLHETQSGILNVDLRHLSEFDSHAYDMIVRFPTELIAIFDNVLETYWTETFGEDDDDDTPRLEVRIHGLKEVHIRSMRQLDPSNINQLVGIRGMVIRASQTIPDLTMGFFRCLQCYNTVEVSVNRGHLPEPTACTNCSGRNTYQMIHNRNSYADKQVVRLQEAPENIPQGETPATLSVLAYDSLVDTARPGDRVEVTGILRAVTIRVNPRIRSVRNIFRTYIDLVHMRIMRGAVDNSSNTADEAFRPLNDVQKEEFANGVLSDSDDIYQRLTDSLAPSIFGMEDAKKGVLLQLLGGTRKEFTSLGGTRFRGELNVLLVGDPGTSKSQILQCVNRLAPRGIYTSGRGSSAVGLTAYVTRDPETRDAVLESGALVLSDEGICCIDEFDKMSDHTRSILHEAMEQQTVSIAKAGIVATLNARTSVLAAANPIESKYNSSRSVVDNIDLPPTLLSRFDLVFLILDQPNAQEDRRLAKHIVSLFYPGEEQPGAGRSAALSAQSLAQYIAYAREKIQPQLTDAASEKLVTGYVEMRGGGVGGEGTRSIGATTRQLESLIRLSEAHARARLSGVVEVSDVEEAMRLMIASIQQSAIDPRTGLIDMDLLMTGRSNAARSQTQHLVSAIWSAITQEFEGRHGTYQEVLAHVREGSSASISDGDFREAVTQLRDESRLHFASGQRLVPHAEHAV